MQEIFDRIFQSGLSNWAVVFEGVCGESRFLGHLPSSCIESFATAELEKIQLDDPLLDIVSDLSTNCDIISSDLCSRLHKMCESQNLDVQQAKRVWRAFALEQILSNLDEEPLYGLIKLSEFWMNWGWPADAPALMLNSGQRFAEQDYHSASNYAHIIHEHELWLQEEFKALKG